MFTRTKHGADKVVRVLEKSGLRAEAIHGNKSQNQRERVLAAFRDGSLRTLVATDIAARGIDVDGVSHVINYDLPNIPESYVHRIGRTARAGAEGVAISFCDHEEGAYLRDIERLIRMTIPSDEPPHRQAPRSAAAAAGARHSNGNGDGHNGNRRNGQQRSIISGGRNNRDHGRGDQRGPRRQWPAHDRGDQARPAGATGAGRRCQTASKMLHSCVSRAARPATARRADRRGLEWRRKRCLSSTAPSPKCCRTAISG